MTKHYCIPHRSSEMYIIREERLKFEDVRAGRENTMFVSGKCMRCGERIRFVEITPAGQRTGREVFCEIEQVFTSPGSKRQLVKYRKVSEYHGKPYKARKGKAARKKIKEPLR